MLQVSFINENKEKVLMSLKKRHFKNTEILDEVIIADDNRKSLQQKLDHILESGNKAAKEIGSLFKQGKREDAEAMKESAASLREEGNQVKQQLDEAKEKVVDLLLQIPNCAHESVPEGFSDEDNLVVKDWPDALPELPESAKPHWELAVDCNIVDFELGAKITGAGFPVYVDKGARLQRALIGFFLNEAGKAGYTEYQVPLVVNEDSARGTGQLPDKEGQMYEITKEGLYLIPTAEVPLTNIYRNVIVQETDFPIKLTGYTPSFRREAGSYGSHVRGLNRLHQFDKVEIVQVQHPDKSYEALEEMKDHVAELLTKLELPFRIVRLCGGDIGFASALTYDFEVYSAAQKRWLEVSSVSNFETFQSNRLKLRFKNANKKTQLAHTLNGSALALPRILASLLENNQTEDGIKIPEALKTYAGFDIIDYV